MSKALINLKIKNMNEFSSDFEIIKTLIEDFLDEAYTNELDYLLKIIKEKRG